MSKKLTTHFDKGAKALRIERPLKGIFVVRRGDKFVTKTGTTVCVQDIRMIGGEPRVFFRHVGQVPNRPGAIRFGSSVYSLLHNFVWPEAKAAKPVVIVSKPLPPVPAPVPIVDPEFDEDVAIPHEFLRGIFSRLSRIEKKLDAQRDLVIGL